MGVTTIMMRQQVNKLKRKRFNVEFLFAAEYFETN